MANAPERLWLATLGEDHAVCIWHKPMAVEYVRADRIDELEAEVKSMAMDYLVAHGQASDAYEAQLLAEAKLNDQTHLIEQLFALLDIKEQKDDGRYFHPNIIRSSRALDAEKFEEILVKLRGYIDD